MASAPLPRARSDTAHHDIKRGKLEGFTEDSPGGDRSENPRAPGDVREALRQVLGSNRQYRADWDPALIADRLALSLCLLRDRIALQLARAARDFLRDKCWFTFGYARIEDHARERFGRSARWVRDLAGLAEATERFPCLGSALTGEDGGRPLGRVVALLIGRNATAETVQGWIALARTKTVRELREEIRTSLTTGAAPSDTDAVCRTKEPGRFVRLDLADGTPVRRPEIQSDQTDILPNDAQLDGCESSSSTISGGDSGRGGSGGGATPATEARTGLEASMGFAGSDHELNEPPVTVRFALPRPVIAALEEARDLHGAISGGHTSLSSFVEALLAETSTCSGTLLHGSDGSRGKLDERSRERMFAKASENWAFLKRLSETSSVLTETEETLSEFDKLCTSATGQARDADALVRSLIGLEDELETRLGQMLAIMGEARAWRPLLFAGLGQYAEERLGIARSTAEDRMRLARSLQSLPTLRGAYEDGEIGASAAAIVGRILAGSSLDPELEERWVAHASRTTVRRLRDELRLQIRESVADDPWRGRGAQEVSQARSIRFTEPAEDAAWHRSLTRKPGDAMERIARYGKVAIDHSLADVPVVAMRLPFSVADPLISTVKAKARAIGSQASESLHEEGGHGSGSIGSSFSMAWGARPDVNPGSDLSMPSPTVSDSERAVSPADSRTFSMQASPMAFEIARTLTKEGRWVPDWVGLFAMIEEFVATWDDPRQSPRRKADKIYIRDGWRCAAPGCTSRENLEDHHVVYRSRHGSDEPSNRVCLCRFHHHRGEHGGLMTCRGEAPLGLTWIMGDLGVGGRFQNDRRI